PDGAVRVHGDVRVETVQRDRPRLGGKGSRGRDEQGERREEGSHDSAPAGPHPAARPIRRSPYRPARAGRYGAATDHHDSKSGYPHSSMRSHSSAGAPSGRLTDSNRETAPPIQSMAGSPIGAPGGMSGVAGG